MGEEPNKKKRIKIYVTFLLVVFIMAIVPLTIFILATEPEIQNAASPYEHHHENTTLKEKY